MKKSTPLKVQAFTTEARNDSSLDKEAQFDFNISPQSFISTHENQFSRKKGINTSGRTAPFAFSNSDEIALELILDDTLYSSLTQEESIKETVERYLKYCFYMDGDIHEPRFLKLSWGGIEFECRLKSVKVSYSIFNDNGEARRAKLENVFIADMPTSKRILLENKKSPDISHSRTVLQGQTLTGLTKEVYGDAAHYLLVAEANNLDHFRCLEPGTTLHFPPLVK